MNFSHTQELLCRPLSYETPLTCKVFFFSFGPGKFVQPSRATCYKGLVNSCALVVNKQNEAEAIVAQAFKYHNRQTCVINWNAVQQPVSTILWTLVPTLQEEDKETGDSFMSKLV